jgi:hypothetical protein
LKMDWPNSFMLIKCVFKGRYGCCEYLWGMRGIWYYNKLLIYTYLVGGQKYISR